MTAVIQVGLVAVQPIWCGAAVRKQDQRVSDRKPYEVYIFGIQLIVRRIQSIEGSAAQVVWESVDPVEYAGLAVDLITCAKLPI